MTEDKAAVITFGGFANKSTCPVPRNASSDVPQMLFYLSFRDGIAMSQIAGGVQAPGKRVGDLLPQR
ncbi:MAG TPA: hypothetical protein VGJ57_07390 [Nitrospirales bacterium]|jgi:hypothetical protein